jgi:hypothetical protein
MAKYVQWQIPQLAGFLREKFMSVRDRLPESCFDSGAGQREAGEGSSIRRAAGERQLSTEYGGADDGGEEGGGEGGKRGQNGRLASFEIMEGADEFGRPMKKENISEWQAGWNVTNAIQVRHM